MRRITANGRQSTLENEDMLWGRLFGRDCGWSTVEMGERIMAAGGTVEGSLHWGKCGGGGLQVSSIYTAVTRGRALP